MKRFLLGTLVVLGTLTPAWTLDAQRMAALEQQEGELMQTDAAPLLLAKEAAGLPSLAGADATTTFEAGVIAHNLSRAQPGKGWALKAVSRFQSATKASDQELAALALAYLGSAKALQATEDVNPAMKIALVNQGWDLLTEAVNKTGESSFVPRLVRASVGQSLPEFFEKSGAVIEDCNWLRSWAGRHPGRVENGTLAQVALMEGNALKRTKDLDGAIAAWKQAVVLDPKKTGPGKAAAAALELYDE